MSDIADLITAHVRDIPDYPQPGVLFKDITPLLGDSDAFGDVVEAIAAIFGPVDKVVGIEARGFILAAPVAFEIRAGFVPVRKQGKLPSATFAQQYDLEYGSAVLEVHQDAFQPGERVLIVDDVLATGGTARAAATLVRQAGAEVVGVAVLMELSFLNGRQNVGDLAVRALLTVRPRTPSSAEAWGRGYPRPFCNPSTTVCSSPRQPTLPKPLEPRCGICVLD